MAELRAVVDFGGDPRQLLDQELAHQRGVPRGAASHQVDSPRARQLLFGEIELGDVDGARFQGDASPQRVGDGLGLLVDLLEHEVPVTALLGGHGVPGDPPGGARQRPCGGVEDAESARPHLGDLAVFQEGHVPGVLEQRRDVRGDEGLAVALADDDGRGVLGHDEAVGVAPAQEYQRVRTVDLPDGLPYGLQQIHPLGEPCLGEMGHELGVGIRVERRAVPEQGLPELEVVLDDAVVHHHRIAGPVRVGVGLGRAAVGGPAGVADAGVSLHRRLGHERFQPGELAFRAAQRDLPAVEDGDARRVVAAVLQLSQAVDEHCGGVTAADVSHDSAHAA